MMFYSKNNILVKTICLQKKPYCL